MLKHVNLIEVPGTSFEAKPNQFTGLLAKRTAPVFEAENKAQVSFTEVVAVTYRNALGVTTHGAMFGYGPSGVTRIALKDLAGKVDTDKNPKHIALGLLLMNGPLVFRQGGGEDSQIPVSIIDLYEGVTNILHAPTPARESAKRAYVEEFIRDKPLTRKRDRHDR